MSTYTVVDFNGNSHDIQADGMTQDQAQAAFENYLRSQSLGSDTRQKLQGYDPRKEALRTAYESAGPVDRFGIGVANSALERWEGMKQLAGQAGPETQERLRIARDTPYDVPGGLGYMAGEIAQAMPAAALARAAGLGPLGAEVLAGGVQEGLRGVPAGENALGYRMRNAAVGAAGAPLMYAPGGVTPQGEAASLVARAQQAGVPMRLTPGQSAGGAWPAVEQTLEALPLVGSVARNQQRQGLQDWNRLVLNEVSPYAGVRGYGQQGLREVNQQFRRGYDEVIEAAPEVIRPSRTSTDIIDQTREYYSDRLSTDALETFTKQADLLAGKIEVGDIPREAFKVTKGELDDLASGAFRNGDVMAGRAYNDLSKGLTAAFRDGLPPEVAARLDHLDAKYSEFLPVVRASALTGAAKNDVLTPDNLMSGIRAEDQSLRKKQFALGTRPLQEDTQAALDSLGRRIPDMGPGTAEKVMGGAGLGYALADPVGAAALATGLGATSATMQGLAPAMRGGLPGQAAYRGFVSGLAPGVPSQVGEQILHQAGAALPEAQAGQGSMRMTPEMQALFALEAARRRMQGLLDLETAQGR